jgi:hypothetical protein
MDLLELSNENEKALLHNQEQQTDILIGNA